LENFLDADPTFVDFLQKQVIEIFPGNRPNDAINTDEFVANRLVQAIEKQTGVFLGGKKSRRRLGKSRRRG